MDNQNHEIKCSDYFESVEDNHPFDLTCTSWLIGQGIRYLQTTDERGETWFKYVTELLGSRKDAVEAIIQRARQASSYDIPLRWNLLYLLGEIADQNAAEFLIKVATDRLPEEKVNGGCEGTRDGEILIYTMAVEALKRISIRHPDNGSSILKIVSERPTKPILIEAVKAAIELGFKDRVQEVMHKDDHWMLGIRQARIDEIYVESERKDTKERGFTPPKISTSLSSSPGIACPTQRECTQ